MEVLKEGLLKVDPGLFLWTVITFLFLVLILWKAAWKPIVLALDARTERIRNDIDSAEKNRQEAEKTYAQYKELMNKSKEEAEGIISEAKINAEKIKSDILENANKESKSIVERGRIEISMAKDKALSELKEEIVIFSTEIASKIITRNLNSDDQKVIVNDAINKIGSIQ